MTAADLAAVRRAYARQVLAAAGIADPALERAFAATARERFLGPGPWRVLRANGYAETPDADPVFLYTDDLVAIDAARGLNNGLPSFLATMIHAARVGPGDHAVHVGTGTGYYTAVMAHLAGPGGRVTGIEVDPGLAARAADSLRGLPAAVLAGDGARTDFAPADAVLVNAGAVRPADLWLDRLKPGGRLVLPLTVAGTEAGTRGAVFVVTREGEGFGVRHLSPTRIFPCAGLRDAEGERRLAEAFARGDARAVRRLHRRPAAPGEQVWLDGDGWCLTG